MNDEAIEAPAVVCKPLRGGTPPRRILAMRFQALGDTIITLPYLQSLRRRFPEAELHFLTREEVSAVPRAVQLFDRVIALGRLAPADAAWVHDVEGPDDMPAHVKTMLTGVSLHVPVSDGVLALGTWQGIYVAEHRDRPHRREIVLQFVGSRR